LSTNQFNSTNTGDYEGCEFLLVLDLRNTNRRNPTPEKIKILSNVSKSII